MPETKRPLKVFLCHASQDKPAVRELAQRLFAEGWIDPWLDEKKLLPGQDWRSKIEEAVETSDIVIICLSSNSVNKEGFVQKELRYAREIALEKLEDSIFLIPLRLDDCETPRGLRFYQWADYFGEKKDETYTQLLQSLETRYQQKLRLKDKAHATDLERATVPVPQSGKPKRDLSKPKSSSIRKLPRKWNTQIIMAIIGVAVLVAIFGIFPKIFKPPPTATPTIDIQAPSRTSIALTPSQPSISGPTGTDTSTCIDREGIPMCLVPAGKFTMGNDNGTAEEQPVQTVDLDQFYIDKFEVTNAFYKACVEAGGCNPPKYAKSHTHASYYDNSEFEDYPVIYVDWKQATSYCKWRGARLPTEAEWEKAARGTDGRSYPWIEDPIDCSYANYADCEGDTTAVGSYEKGRSPYGIYDMAGNVREWVSSLYFPYPYSMTDGRENPDVTAGSRVLRGGAWTRSGRDGVRSTYRYKSGPDDNLDYVGFRCARDVD